MKAMEPTKVPHEPKFCKNCGVLIAYRDSPGMTVQRWNPLKWCSRCADIKAKEQRAAYELTRRGDRMLRYNRVKAELEESRKYQEQFTRERLASKQYQDLLKEKIRRLGGNPDVLEEDGESQGFLRKFFEKRA